jgi:hypothetical protein
MILLSTWYNIGRVVSAVIEQRSLCVRKHNIAYIHTKRFQVLVWYFESTPITPCASMCLCVCVCVCVCVRVLSLCRLFLFCCCLRSVLSSPSLGRLPLLASLLFLPRLPPFLGLVALSVPYVRTHTTTYICIGLVLLQAIETATIQLDVLLQARACSNTLGPWNSFWVICDCLFYW